MVPSAQLVTEERKLKMIDINLLKENPADFDLALKKQQDFEKNGRFNEDENENTYEGCDPVDETFNYLRRRYRDRLKHMIYLRSLKRYCKKINRELTNLKVVLHEYLVLSYL